MTIHGVAHERAASIEVDDTTVSWRAQRGHLHPTPEVVDLALDELRQIVLAPQRGYRALMFGLFAIAVGGAWIVFGDVEVGAVAAAFGAFAFVVAFWRPRWYLVLATADRAFVLRVAPRSLAEARQLVAVHGRAVAPLPAATALRS